MVGDGLVDLRIVPYDATTKVRRDCAWRYDVDRDPARRELKGHIARQRINGCLHRPVDRPPRKRETCQPRGNVHNPSAVVEERQQILHQQEWSLEMHCELSVKLRFGARCERGR